MEIRVAARVGALKPPLAACRSAAISVSRSSHFLPSVRIGLGRRLPGTVHVGLVPRCREAESRAARISASNMNAARGGTLPSLGRATTPSLDIASSANIRASIDRYCEMTDGAIHRISGSSLATSIRSVSAKRRARPVTLEASSGFAIFAAATRFATGFKSNPIALCPISCATRVVVPLPFQGSKTVNDVPSPTSPSTPRVNSSV